VIKLYGIETIRKLNEIAAEKLEDSNTAFTIQTPKVDLRNSPRFRDKSGELESEHHTPSC